MNNILTTFHSLMNEVFDEEISEETILAEADRLAAEFYRWATEVCTSEACTRAEKVNPEAYLRFQDLLAQTMSFVADPATPQKLEEFRQLLEETKRAWEGIWEKKLDPDLDPDKEKEMSVITALRLLADGCQNIKIIRKAKHRLALFRPAYFISPCRLLDVCAEYLDRKDIETTWKKAYAEKKWKFSFTSPPTDAFEVAFRFIDFAGKECLDTEVWIFCVSDSYRVLPIYFFGCFEKNLRLLWRAQGRAYRNSICIWMSASPYPIHYPGYIYS